MLRISQRKQTLKPRDRKSTPSHLPVELWIEILKIVIYSTLPISETSSSDDFPKVLCRWRSYQRYHKRRNPPIHVPTTKPLRLVCRAWLNIVRDLCKHRHSPLPAGHPARFIAVNGHIINSLPIFDKVSKLGDQTPSIKPNPLQALLPLGRTISTLLVSGLDLWRLSMHSDKNALSFLIKNPQYFPNLYSLSLKDYRIHVHIFSGIEKGFPQLTSFQLSRCLLEGNVYQAPTFRLRHLEIAEFDMRGDLLPCSFPALRHLSLNPRNLCSNIYYRLISSRISPLESVVDRSSYLDGVITWGNHNLTLLGARTEALRSAIQYIRQESSRKLRHVWILDWTDETLRTIEMILKSGKGLTRLTIDTSHIPASSLRYLQIMCKRKEIQLVELAEM